MGRCSSGRFVRPGPGSAPLLAGAQQTGPAGFKAQLEGRFAERRRSKWQVLAVCRSFLLREKISEGSPLPFFFHTFSVAVQAVHSDYVNRPSVLYL